MGKVIGTLLLFGAIGGGLYNWLCSQREKQSRMEAFGIFLQKSIFVMEKEKVHIIPYLKGYFCKEEILKETLEEIAERLSRNQFPDAVEVWETVFWEKRKRLGVSENVLNIMKASGQGFFGRSREENICFLQKCLKELEAESGRIKEKDAQERKVWVPVGMLGGIMLLIILF